MARLEDDMTTAKDPVRLRRVMAHDTVLARGLAAAQARGPSDEQLVALERGVFAATAITAAVGATLAAHSASSVATVASATWWSAGAAKLVLAGVTAVALGGGATVAWHTASKTKAPAATHASSAATTRAKARKLEASAAVAPVIEPADRAPEEVAAPVLATPPEVTVPFEPTRAKPVAKAHAPARAAAPATDDEVALLDRAHRALAGEPSRALTLAREHARSFPTSSLDEERELIVVTALVKLDRVAEARRLVEAFSARRPGSTYLPKMNVLVGARR